MSEEVREDVRREVAGRCPTVVIVSGVTGAGKTTVGRALAAALGRAFVDADDHHPLANVAKMQRGAPLEDADRLPWLLALRELIGECLATRRPAVLACSALRRRYRDLLVPIGADAGEVRVVLLAVPQEVATARVTARAEHFMPSSLVPSQFAALEPDDALLRVDATRPVSEVVTAIRAGLGC